jgi:hypothetical protein
VFETALGQLIAQIESGGNPNASLTDYAGNTSVNALFQQSAAYVQTYGSGEAGVINQAQGLLASNPNATLGDFYSLYNHGSVLPFGQYASRFPLQANNFLTNANAAGFNQNTPLSSLLGGSGVSGIDGASSVQFSNDDLSAAAASGLGSDTPNLTDADFEGLTDADVTGGTTAGTLTGASGLGSVGGGVAVDLTDPTNVASTAGGDVQKGLGTVGSAATSSTNSIDSYVSSAINSLEQSFGEAFLMIALVVMGIVLVAFGLGLFGKDRLPSFA